MEILKSIFRLFVGIFMILTVHANADPVAYTSETLFLNDLADFIADKDITAIQLFVETSGDKNYAVQCAPSDIPYYQPLQRVFH